jgi:hypothetical protein
MPLLLFRCRFRHVYYHVPCVDVFGARSCASKALLPGCAQGVCVCAEGRWEKYFE